MISDAEVLLVDKAMNDHMNHHAVSNNPNGMVCLPRCRQEALGKAINKVMAEHQPTFHWPKDYTPVIRLLEMMSKDDAVPMHYQADCLQALTETFDQRDQCTGQIPTMSPPAERCSLPEGHPGDCQ